MRIGWLALGAMAACDGTEEENLSRYVFVTNLTYPADLGGLEGADAKCELAAQAAGGTGEHAYHAWLSDGTTDAIDRMADDLGPWFRTDDQIAFNNKANLTTLPVLPVDRNENGVQTYGCAWTGTAVGGTATADRCDDWTNGSEGLATTGNVSSAEGSWTADNVATCGSQCALYCFQQ